MSGDRNSVPTAVEKRGRRQ